MYKYLASRESERIKRGEAIIRRVEPGPCQDPIYLAVLAFQASSIELAQDLALAPDLSSSIILGTVPGPVVNAYTEVNHIAGHQVVMLNSGLVEFMYQAAKCVIEATNPGISDEPDITTSATLELDKIKDHLLNHSGPSDRLYRTLEGYLFNGYPRSSVLEANLPKEHGPPLSYLIGLAERWVIAHEYGHGQIPKLSPPDNANPHHTEEYIADAQATFAIVLSAADLDAVRPEVAIGSAIFALKCLDICARALRLVATGSEVGEAGGSHPAPVDRAHHVLRTVRQFFRIEYHPDHTFDLWVEAYSDPSDAPELPSLIGDTAWVAWEILELVWQQAKLRLEDDRDHGRSLHAIWD